MKGPLGSSMLFLVVLCFLAVQPVQVFSAKAAWAESDEAARNGRETEEAGGLDKDLLRELGGDYEQAESSAVPDPLQPFNRVMFQLNDSLYVYFFRPVARGYAAVLPEPARSGIDRVFYNLRYPGRLVNNLLQARFKRAFKESGRFLVNTVWGLAGWFEPAESLEALSTAPPKKDTGMTLAVWGLEEGFYIVWPVFGPSTARDSVGSAGDYFLDPLSYVEPWYVSTGLSVEERINSISLKLGEYEDLKKAALDPYTALRDAFLQYRRAQIQK